MFLGRFGRFYPKNFNLKISVRYIILYIGRYKTSPYIGQYNHRAKILEIVYIDQYSPFIGEY